jgi:hypothetical protein
VSWEGFCYYRERLTELVYGSGAFAWLGFRVYIACPPPDPESRLAVSSPGTFDSSTLASGFAGFACAGYYGSSGLPVFLL